LGVLKLVGWLSGDSRVPSLVWYVIVDETDETDDGTFDMPCTRYDSYLVISLAGPCVYIDSTTYNEKEGMLTSVLAIFQEREPAIRSKMKQVKMYSVYSTVYLLDHFCAALNTLHHIIPTQYNVGFSTRNHL
jgi:hypothetical protein